MFVLRGDELGASQLVHTYSKCSPLKGANKIDASDSVTSHIGHLYLSRMWLQVASTMETEKICVQERLDYMLTI